MPSTTFPDGSTLVSSALAPAALNALLQTLTCQMLGIDPASDALAYSKVRLDWPTGGQPAFAITDDVAFLRTTEEDDQYNRIRDKQISPNNSTSWPIARSRGGSDHATGLSGGGVPGERTHRTPGRVTAGVLTIVSRP